jgi:hypothetical protein
MEISRIKEYIDTEGFFIATPVGTSMWPMLRNRRDNVYLIKYEGGLKKYDLPVYIRADGKHVMHRCLGKSQDGTYIMCGDHQWTKEYGIREDQIIAVAQGFYRDNKFISCDSRLYKLYYRLWSMSLFLRHCALFVIHRFIPYQKTWDSYKNI